MKRVMIAIQVEGKEWGMTRSKGGKILGPRRRFPLAGKRGVFHPLLITKGGGEKGTEYENAL